MLTGTLDDFTLADVLRLVANARRTGRLDVSRPAGTGRLWFRDGAVAAAAPGYERRRAAPTPEARIEDLTFDLMRWDLGEFAWESTGTDAPEAAASVDVDGLLREVSRRLEELAEIETLVPSEHAVLAMAPQPPEGAVQINITPAEWRVLVLVDGRRTVSEIGAAAGMDDLDAMKVLFGLASAGLVATTGAPAPAAPEPQVQTPPDPEPELHAQPEPAFALPLSETVSDMTDVTVMSDVSDAPSEDTYVEPEPPAPLDDPFLSELGPMDESPAVDRSTAARELAGLFDLGEPAAAAALAPAPPRPRRLEDDDQVTRGLITRLIDGVKGL